MKALGNLIAAAGTVLFAYALVARFLGEKSIMGLTSIPALGEGFTAVGVFSAAACTLLVGIVLILNSKD